MIDPIELQPTSKPNLFKVVRVPCGARFQVVFRLTDDQGKPVNLTTEQLTAPAEEPKFGNEPVLTAKVARVRFLAKDDYSTGRPRVDVDGKILTDCPGSVEFLLDEDQTNRPGIYVAEVGLYAGDYLVNRWQCYLCIEPSVFANIRGHGALTIPEIRLGLDDLEVGEVSLLDGLEFQDVQILHCIRQVVDLWNETPPPVGHYTASNFPYRYHWIQGTMALLYRMAVKKYARNQLNYQAGGISIDDQNKMKEYDAIAEQLMGEFVAWMTREKYRRNMSAAWSSGI